MSRVLKIASAATLGLAVSTADFQAASANEALINNAARQVRSGEIASAYAQYRHVRGGRYYGRPYAGRHFYRRGHGGAAAAGLIGGLATGALIGGAIASQQAQAAVPVEDDAVAYCMQRFQSYDPASGTYLGYDGMRHPCP